MDYLEKLKDPRWQKKRLEVLERDKWRCLFCLSGAKELHVHHGYYEKGFEPWDYELTTLHTLCKDCHERIEDFSNRLKRQLGKVPMILFDLFAEDVIEVALGYSSSPVMQVLERLQQKGR